MANSASIEFIIKTFKGIKKATIFILLIPVCLYTVLLLLQKKSQEIFFSDPSLEIALYNDEKEGGASTAEILPGKYFTFKTVLKKGAPFPHAGIAIYYAQPTCFILSNTILELNMTVAADVVIPVTLMFQADNKTKTLISDSVVFLQTMVNAVAGSRTYELPISTFKLPEWWLIKHQLNPQDVIPVDLNKTLSISFQSSPFQQTGKACQIEITRLRIKSDLWPIQKAMIVGSCLYYLLLLLSLFYRSKKENIRYVPIYPITRTVQEDPLEKIKDVMAHCFHLADLTVEKVAAESGVPAYKIPILLQEHMGMNFKKFLNLIRMEEAKRLLQDPRIRISEIAYAVGYQHVQHFNRTFKEATSLTPKEFRMQLPEPQDQKN